MRSLLAGIAAVCALVLVVGVDATGGDKEPKYKIKEVMKEIMKSKLGPKVFAGEGTKEENKKVLDYFIALHSNAPPKGEKSSWDKVTQALVDTAKKIESGEEKGSKKLAGLINCGGCHKEFKK